MKATRNDLRSVDRWVVDTKYIASFGYSSINKPGAVDNSDTGLQVLNNAEQTKRKVKWPDNRAERFAAVSLYKSFVNIRVCPLSLKGFQLSKSLKEQRKDQRQSTQTA